MKDKKHQTILVTGFEPFGGYQINPSEQIVNKLHQTQVGSYEIAGCVLPVALNGLAQRVQNLLHQHQPAAVLSLGLAANTALIRLERIAVNMADFELPDNQGLRCADQSLIEHGAVALSSTLVLQDMLTALLDAGIPAQLSNSAGTYLCNALMYHFLHALQVSSVKVPCGFVHLPYLPEQAAALLKVTGLKVASAKPASMSFELQLRAVNIMLDSIAQQLVALAT